MNAKKIFHFSIGPIGAGFFVLITLPLVSWFFSPEDIGRLAMLQISISFGVMLFSLAMHQAYVREYHEEEDKSALLKMVVFPGFLLLCLILIVVFISPFSISNLLFGINSPLISILLLISIVSAFFINFFVHVLRMQERGLAFSVSQVTPHFFLLLFIGVIVFFNFKNEFENLILVNTAAIFLSFLMVGWLTRKSWIPALSTKIDKCVLRKMLKFSLPLVMGGLAYWGLTAMDRFFLRAISGFEELGIYAIAVTIAGVATVLSVIFSNLWHPVVYKWVKEGVEPNRVQTVIENMFLVVVLVWSLAGIFSWLILYLLPSHYLAVEYLIVACIAMPLFYMLSEATVVGIGITRKTSYAMLAAIVAFIVNAILNYILIPEHGASGAAIASAISFFLFFIIRTESSAYLWVSLPRLKIYVMMLAYLVLTIIMVLSKATYEGFFLIWIALLVVSFLLFKSRVVKSIKYLKNYNFRNV